MLCAFGSPPAHKVKLERAAWLLHLFLATNPLIGNFMKEVRITSTPRVIVTEVKCRCVGQIISVPRKPFSSLWNVTGAFSFCTVVKMRDVAIA